MNEDIVKKLEDDYCKLSKKLYSENQEDKKKLIIGALGYIENLIYRIEGNINNE